MAKRREEPHKHSSQDVPCRDDATVCSVDAVAWVILQALHTGDDRPMSWSDMNEGQELRIRAAAIAAQREIERLAKDAHYAPSAPVVEPDGVEALIERLKIEASEDLDGEVRESAIEAMRAAASALSRLKQERDANARDGYRCGQALADMEMRAETAEQHCAELESERDLWLDTALIQGRGAKKAGKVAAEAIAESAALRAQLKVRDEALRFYANSARYEPGYSHGTSGIGFAHGEIHDRDRGSVARAALAEPAPKVETVSDE